MDEYGWSAIGEILGL